MRYCCILLLISLCSCAGQSNPPPNSPTAVQIAAEKQSVESSGLTPSDYFTYGSILVARNCNNWFAAQINGAQQTSLAQGALGIGTGAAGIAGGPAGAGAAAGMGLLSALLNNNQANSSTGLDPIGDWILINKTLQAYQSAITIPNDFGTADAFVESYAELCQLPDIQAAIRAAKSTAVASAVNSNTIGFNFGT